jgi:hypothetical protein
LARFASSGSAVRRLHHRPVVEHDRALGHVGGVVADALDVGGDAQRAVDLAQVARHRLAQRQQAQHVLADLLLEHVDGDVVVDHALRRLGVAAARARRWRHPAGHGDLAHARDLAVQALELGVVALDDVFVRVVMALVSSVSRSDR